jgi:hypothetical protein
MLEMVCHPNPILHHKPSKELALGWSPKLPNGSTEGSGVDALIYDACKMHT